MSRDGAENILTFESQEEEGLCSGETTRSEEHSVKESLLSSITQVGVKKEIFVF